MAIIDYKRNGHPAFDDIVSYLLGIVSLTLTFEIYRSKSPGVYSENDRMSLTSKQLEKNLILYPEQMLNNFFIDGRWPDIFKYEFEDVKFENEPPAKLPLAHLDLPLLSFSQTLILNFYEKNINTIEGQYGKPNQQKFPNVWNFGRIVRNSVSHNNEILINNANASPMSWLKLSYGPFDNGKNVVHHDLWGGDLILLVMEMEKYL